MAVIHALCVQVQWVTVLKTGPVQYGAIESEIINPKKVAKKKDTK